MNCGDVQIALTPYLDGELDIDRGREVRGHLRSCAACRQVAREESLLRDGLRALPTLDPPGDLWRGIARQLANAELADATGPRWRRVVARWQRSLRGLTVATAAVAIAIAIVAAVGIWRASHRGLQAARPELAAAPAATAPEVAIAPVVATPEGAPCSSLGPRDLAFDLKTEPTCVTEAYAAAATSLLDAALEQRALWSDEHQSEFNAKLDQLRRDIDLASEGRPRQRAYRALIRYLQRVTSRDEVELAGVRGAP